MIQVKSKHPPGTVAFIAANLPRYHVFFDYIEQLRVPEGTVLAKSILYNAARNRNEVTEIMQGDWIFYLDDDNFGDPNLLLNLLDREVDIVAPPYPRRYPPFETVAFSCYHPDVFMPCTFSEQEHIWTLHDWSDFDGKQGLIEIEATGFGAVLVRKNVLKKMIARYDKPLFRVGAYESSWVEDALVRDEMQEDLSFCWAARRIGFKVHLDLDQWLGHMTEVQLIPRRDQNGHFRVMSAIEGQYQWITK